MVSHCWWWHANRTRLRLFNGSWINTSMTSNSWKHWLRKQIAREMIYLQAILKRKSLRIASTNTLLSFINTECFMLFSPYICICLSIYNTDNTIIFVCGHELCIFIIFFLTNFFSQITVYAMFTIFWLDTSGFWSFCFFSNYFFVPYFHFDALICRHNVEYIGSSPVCKFINFV